MMQVIEILITPSGQSTVQTKGFSGSSCREASRFIEQALGARIRETLTAECHQSALSQQPLQESG
jgi:hypothetical protein